MSWLVALSTSQRAEAPPLPAAPLHTAAQPGLTVAVGGNPDTCAFHSDTDSSSGWAVVGTGILLSGSRATMMTHADWANVLSRPDLDPRTLDGHFVAMRWRGETIEIFTDQLGLRTLYWGECAGGIFVSTRLDWVTAATGHGDLDFQALGSRWLLFNQMSYASGVKQIGRLGPGGRAQFRSGSLMGSAVTPWIPQSEPASPGEALDLAGAFVGCALDHQLTPALALSGGLDSRLLLAFLVGSGSADFTTYSIGDPADPDVRVAGEMTSHLNLRHSDYCDPLPDPHTCLEHLRSYVAQVHLVEPASTWSKLRYYPVLRERGHLVIDGGYGEFGRRQFFNRVVRLGRAAVRARDGKGLIHLVGHARADIFVPEVARSLEQGALAALQEALDSMPARRLDPGDFMDLLAVRFRIPNSGGPEQARQDSEVLNFMPLAQPSYLRAVLAVPAHFRANGRAYYDRIRMMDSRLMRFPRVKGGDTIPFGLSTNLSWLIARAKALAGKGYVDPRPDELLMRLREYVLDLVHSAAVSGNGIYDNRKVVAAVDRYYRGDGRGRSAVDWWLTFELWKQALGGSPGQGSNPGGTRRYR